jgi:hypothetical protein
MQPESIAPDEAAMTAIEDRIARLIMVMPPH